MATAEPDGLIADVSSWSWIHWTGVFLSLGVAAINGYVGYTAGEPQFLAIAGSFLLGVGLYVSQFWRPILYVVGVLHVAILAVLWLLDGMRLLLFGVASGVLSAGLAAIALYLFFEHRGVAER